MKNHCSFRNQFPKDSLHDYILQSNYILCAGREVSLLGYWLFAPITFAYFQNGTYKNVNAKNAASKAFVAFILMHSCAVPHTSYLLPC